MLPRLALQFIGAFSLIQNREPFFLNITPALWSPKPIHLKERDVWATREKSMGL